MKGHKWFAAIYDKLSESAERKFAGAIREEMLADVRGEVLEIGAGTGVNFPYYKEAARVIAREPDPLHDAARREAGDRDNGQHRVAASRGRRSSLCGRIVRFRDLHVRPLQRQGSTKSANGDQTCAKA